MANESIVLEFRDKYRHYLDGLSLSFADKQMAGEIGNVAIECFFHDVASLELEKSVESFERATKFIFPEWNSPYLARQDIPAELIHRWIEVIGRFSPEYVYQIQAWKRLGDRRARHKLWLNVGHRCISRWVDDLHRKVFVPFITSHYEH